MIPAEPRVFFQVLGPARRPTYTSMAFRCARNSK